jgi:peptide/nickel transport system permease protein
MYRFIFHRLLQMLLVLLGTVTVLFAVLYFLVPGDAAQAVLGSHATSESLTNLRHQMGLDRPVWVQYGIYLWNLAHLDLGRSYILNRDVIDVIREHLPATAYLAAAALFLETVIGLGWGMFMATRRTVRAEILSSVLGATLLAIPVFFLGMLLQRVFGSWLGILPISGGGGGNPAYVILPAFTLALAQAVIISAVTRDSLSAEMGKEYMLAARARGLTMRRALWSHGLRNALAPVMTLMAIDLGVLMGGAIITEIVFAWPGVGRTMFFAAQSRDVPLILGIVLVLVTIFVVVNTVADIMYRLLDPRVRLGKAGDG